MYINAVPEVLQGKSRVHLDIYTASLADLIELGSSIEHPQLSGLDWTVMLDPEGGQYCAFLRRVLPQERLHGLVVDSADPALIAGWWSQVLGGDLIEDERGYFTIYNVPGLPIDTFDFVPVPEPKTVKNRIHWDITADCRELERLGATIMQSQDAQNSEIGWTVMQDPEGNEFCVFP